TLGSDLSQSFTTGSFSTMRLQQLLAQLGYLPMTWTPTSHSTVSPTNAHAELAAAYSAPAGTFKWQAGYPWNLTSQWKAGSANILDNGAVRAFESVTGLTMDGSAGRTVWTDLLKAVAKGKGNPNGYTYALASQNYPENLRIWHNGRLVLETPVNTGIAASPTEDGTFPVYLKYYFSYMKGTNPDGASTTTRCTTRPTSTAAMRCTSSIGTATAGTRAWAASSCPGTPPRRLTPTSTTAASSPSPARWPRTAP